MRTINEVATWFKENNLLASNDDLRVKVLSLMQKQHILSLIKN